jgi:hypothetical protein
MAEQGLLYRLTADHELAPDLATVRADLDYLASHELIIVIRAYDVDWRAGTLTETGRVWLGHHGDMGLEIHSPDYLPPQRTRKGRASTLNQLDPEARAWLDQHLSSGRLSYTELAAALKEKGWEITRSAVGRYGKRRKDELAAIRASAMEKAEVAKALASVFSDASDIPAIMHGALGTALVATVDAISTQQYDSSKDTLAGLVGSLPKLGRGFRQAEQHKIEREARQRALQEAAGRVEQAAQARGLSDADASFWREKVLMGM